MNVTYGISFIQNKWISGTIHLTFCLHLKQIDECSAQLHKHVSNVIIGFWVRLKKCGIVDLSKSKRDFLLHWTESFFANLFYADGSQCGGLFADKSLFLIFLLSQKVETKLHQETSKAKGIQGKIAGKNELYFVSSFFHVLAVNLSSSFFSLF